MLDREAVARKLYERWCWGWGVKPHGPDWPAYEAGADLNPVGLCADDFRRKADRIAPLDSPENVARRMCMNNCIPECVRLGCTEVTCIGWEDWLEDAQAVTALDSNPR